MGICAVSFENMSVCVRGDGFPLLGAVGKDFDLETEVRVVGVGVGKRDNFVKEIAEPEEVVSILNNPVKRNVPILENFAVGCTCGCVSLEVVVLFGLFLDGGLGVVARVGDCFCGAFLAWRAWCRCWCCGW